MDGHRDGDELVDGQQLSDAPESYQSREETRWRIVVGIRALVEPLRRVLVRTAEVQVMFYK